MFARYLHIGMWLLIAVLMTISAALYGQQFTNIAVATNPYDQSETAIAVSPLNLNYVMGVWNDFRGGQFVGPGYGFSTDGGNTWYDAVISPLPTPYTFGFDPSVAFDRYGNAFYCYVAYSPFARVAVSRTTSFPPGPAQWNHSLVGSGTDDDKPYMAVDNSGTSADGRIYVSWTDFSSGTQIKFSYSSNHGVTFSTPITLSSGYAEDPGPAASLMPVKNGEDLGDPQSLFVQGSQPAVGPNGDVYVVWADAAGFGYNEAAYKIRKSTDGGVSFGSAVSVSNFTAANYGIGAIDIRSYIPTMAVDPISGYVFVAYADRLSQANSDLRVKFVRSTDGGNSWTSPQVIADFGVGWQYFPWVAADGNGRVSVVVGHSPDLNLVDTYITESYDNGETFSIPARVSSQSSNPGNASWTHHYQGLAALRDGMSFPLWTDYRNGNADPFFASGDLAVLANKAFDASATFSNGARHLLKGGGKLHEQFTNGGQIYYRRSSNNGNSWELTKKISTAGLDNNSTGGLAVAQGNSVHLVWQRKKPNSRYEVWYSRSTDNGGSWSVPVILPSADDIEVSFWQAYGAMPVIAERSNIISTDGGEGWDEQVSDYQLVVVYCSIQGLRYRTSGNNGTSWTTPSPDIISGLYNNLVWFPSLTSGGGFLSLTYDYRPT
jgi:hypothetical protein